MLFTAFAGIDISKKTIDVAILFPATKAVIHRKFDNDQTGFEQVLSFIKNNHSGVLDEVLFCMEHTGVYGFPICNFLSANHLNYTIQSPLHINKSIGIKRGKNDKANAKMLARFAYLNKDEILLSQVPSQIIVRLKNLLTYRYRLLKAKVAIEVAAKELSGFTDKETHLFVLRDSKKYTREMTKSIEQINQEMESTIKGNREVKRIFDLVTSVTGIGLVIATNLIVYTN